MGLIAAPCCPLSYRASGGRNISCEEPFFVFWWVLFALCFQ